MGFGDHLIWTGVISALRDKYREKDLVIARMPTLEDISEGYIFRQGYIHTEWDVFLYNPDVRMPNDGDRLTWRYDPLRKLASHLVKLIIGRKQFPLNLLIKYKYCIINWFIRPFDLNKTTVFLYLNHPKNSYWRSVSREKATAKNGAHSIQIICTNYGIKNADKTPKLYFSKGEINKANKIYDLSSNYIILDPHHNERFSPNKGWLFEYWQDLVNEIKSCCDIVQIGVKNGQVLENVVDLTGLTSFREAAILIKHSRLLICTEGGLSHIAAAVQTKAVVIYGGFIHPNLMGYNHHVNLFTELACSPCGLRIACPYGLECMKRITPQTVAGIVRRLLGCI